MLDFQISEYLTAGCGILKMTSKLWLSQAAQLEIHPLALLGIAHLIMGFNIAARKQNQIIFREQSV